MPNVHGGLARKKARIVICGTFQEVHPAKHDSTLKALSWDHDRM